MKIIWFPETFFLVLFRFFIITIGGILVGIRFGFMPIFMTKFTGSTPILEPLVVFIYVYIVAEMTKLSGVLA